MSKAKQDELTFELEILENVLDFHAKNAQLWVGKKSEYEDHINDILDKIIEIKKQLKEIEKQ